MFYLNKIVWFFLNPASLLLTVALVAAVRRCRWLACTAIALLWFFATPAAVALLGLPLERAYLETAHVNALPAAEAIVVLGGGIGKVESMAYPDMYDGADRLWHAARLYKAGKAPKVIVSGSNDLNASVPLLLDFGLPREAIVVDNESRNTYENSRFTEKLLGAKTKVLLVTSAWHMPRACGNFSKTSLEVVPAACDFAATSTVRGTDRWWDWLMPSGDGLYRSSFLFKEWLGKLARK